MNSPIYCMDALRDLATDTSLDPASRLLAAEQVVKLYQSQGANPVEQRRMLRALDSEIAIEPPKAGHFWYEVRDIIVQRLNAVMS